MAADSDMINEIAMLVSHSFEGEISKEHFHRLQLLLKSSLQTRKYYYQILSMYSFFHDACNFLLLHNERQGAEELKALNDLLAKGNCAPSIDLSGADKVSCEILAVDPSKVNQRLEVRFDLKE